MTNATGYWKWLGPGGAPCNGGRGLWPLPNGKPGAWLRVDGPLEPCANGLHLCEARDLLSWIGPTLWVAEARGDSIRHNNKTVVREARLLYQVETWNDVAARLFAADCAESVLHVFERERPDDDRAAQGHPSRTRLRTRPAFRLRRGLRRGLRRLLPGSCST